MTKLNQIIAVSQGKKSQSEKALAGIYHKLQAQDLLSGISRTYQPLDDDGERFPPESKRVQLTVKQAVEEVSPVLEDWFDVVATQETANTEAAADVTVDGAAVLTGVPVTVLLFLEKRLIDLQTFVGKIPTLDPADEWSYDANSDAFVTPEHQTAKTKKVPKVVVKYDATEHHPAQTEMFTEDQVVGYWSTRKFSGALPAAEKKAMQRRVADLLEAVKKAREEANSIEAPQQKIGAAVLGYVFGG